MDHQAVLALRELYRRVPKVNCKRLCGHACRTLIDMSHTERERIETYVGEPLPEWMREVPGMTCPLLSETGECTVYGLRPMVCRVWGATDSPGLRCPHGCTVEGEPLSAVQMQRLMLDALRAGGSQYGDKELDALQEVLSSEDMGPLLDRYIDGDHSPDLLAAFDAKVRTTMPIPDSSPDTGTDNHAQ